MSASADCVLALYTPYPSLLPIESSREIRTAMNSVPGHSRGKFCEPYTFLEGGYVATRTSVGEHAERQFRVLSVCSVVSHPWALASGCVASLLDPARVSFAHVLMGNKIACLGYGFP